MSCYRITAKCVPISVDRTRGFLSDPANLSLITPPHMKFEIRCGGAPPIYAGRGTQYRTPPVKGLRTCGITGQVIKVNGGISTLNLA